MFYRFLDEWLINANQWKYAIPNKHFETLDHINRPYLDYILCILLIG